MIKYYFGTDVDEHGHYMWEISDDGLRFVKRSLNFNTIPFSPEYITQNIPNGHVNWLMIQSSMGAFTICAIAGSCKDDRPGCKSVFWVNEIIPFMKLKEEILATPLCAKIIHLMKFEVKW